ncbi:hypothetical protein OROGR_001363 [Orobanche gracilis]
MGDAARFQLAIGPDCRHRRRDGSVQICEIAESGMLDGTGDERVPEIDFGFDEQIEERLPDVWESEEARIKLYKLMGIFYPVVLTLI